MAGGIPCVGLPLSRGVDMNERPVLARRIRMLCDGCGLIYRVWVIILTIKPIKAYTCIACGKGG